MCAERGLAPGLIGAISRSDCLRVRAITDGCVRRHGMRRFHPLNVDGWLEQTHFSRSAALFTDRAEVPRAYKTGPRYACCPPTPAQPARCPRTNPHLTSDKLHFTVYPHD